VSIIVRRRHVTCAVFLSLLFIGCGSSNGSVGPSAVGSLPTLTASSAVLVGAGDIGVCGSPNPELTARLLDGIDGIVFTAGDNAYPSGSAQQFHDCYDPTWGRHRSRTRPSPGNHDYESTGAVPYFEYFGLNAGPPGLGYYSFSAGPWHVVSLNSALAIGFGSNQLEWLRDDLASTRAACVAAIWHHPFFSVGPHATMMETRDVWQVLYEAGADVVINGHDHIYQRFAPQRPDGVSDPQHGIREFVVGTGGAELASVTRTRANLETAIADRHGVLKLTLLSTSYSWQFITVGGGTADVGTDTCR
jgi:hypothetical protein